MPIPSARREATRTKTAILISTTSLMARPATAEPLTPALALTVLVRLHRPGASFGLGGAPRLDFRIPRGLRGGDLPGEIARHALADQVAASGRS
ncbi:hypothetical protein MKK88_04590 [Methylobacterium sp. E-005]|uniref:hypothetical protein n=1 Tax=Methylobacterium sp. E-005 TaxID=2836549 RepID=UPI001FB94E9A|nr:hypothetical protein [Methylobacterium sp. E-005]MCJ2085274.1 hypothetical protein [Methylobacterium sp. E-005]